LPGTPDRPRPDQVPPGPRGFHLEIDGAIDPRGAGGLERAPTML